MRHGGIRVSRQGLAEQGHRLRRASQPRAEHAEIVQGSEMRGIRSQRSAIELLRLPQPPALVTGDGPIERLRHGERGVG